MAQKRTVPLALLGGVHTTATDCLSWLLLWVTAFAVPWQALGSGQVEGRSGQSRDWTRSLLAWLGMK